MRFFLIFLLLSPQMELNLSNNNFQREKSTCITRGRAVDESGKPLAHANIFLLPVEDNSWERLIIPHNTDEHGNLCIEGKLPAESQEYMFYATTYYPLNTVVPLNVPFSTLSAIDSRYAGQKVTHKKGEKLELGDIPVKIHFGLATIRLEDERYSPLITVRNEIPRIKLRVRNQDGIILSENKIPSDLINRNNSSFDLALPEGKWVIEIGLGFSTTWPLTSKSQDIEIKQQHLYLTVKL